MATQQAEGETGRPFRSLKKAIAVVGKRFRGGHPKSSQKAAAGSTTKQETVPEPVPSASSSSSATSSSVLQVNQEEEGALVSLLTRVASELEETKRELVLLKERESEMEVVAASLNSELRRSMSRLAEAEAAAADARRSTTTSLVADTGSRLYGSRNVGGGLSMRLEFSPRLAELLSLGEEEDGHGERKEMTRILVKKDKAVVPLITDVFSRKRGASTRRSLLYGPHV